MLEGSSSPRENLPCILRLIKKSYFLSFERPVCLLISQMDRTPLAMRGSIRAGSLGCSAPLSTFRSFNTGGELHVPAPISTEISALCAPQLDQAVAEGREGLVGAEGSRAFFLLVGAYFAIESRLAFMPAGQGNQRNCDLFSTSNPLIDAQLRRCPLGADTDGSSIPEQTPI